MDIAPKPIEFFKEWEHTYLVESYIYGLTIHQFVANQNPFITPNASIEDINQYFKKTVEIITRLLLVLEKIHNANIIVGDIGPDNIVLDENYIPRIIDFDGAVDLDKDDQKYLFATLGYYNKNVQADNFKRDFIGIGYLLFYMLVPCSNLRVIDDEFCTRFLNYLIKHYSLPKEFLNLITALLDVKINYTPRQYIDIIKNINFTSNKKVNIKFNKQDGKTIINKISKFILNSKLNSDNQLFPCDYNAKEYLSITYGASGVLRAFDYCGIKYNPEYKKWVIKKTIDNLENIPLGLHYGLAGVCWFLIETGEIKEAKIMLEYIKSKFISMKKVDLGYGLSGVGMLFIKAYMHLKDINYLNQALRIGNLLLNERKDHIENMEYIGYEMGKTGVSLFLLYLSSLTKNKYMMNFGLKILFDDINTGKIINGGYLFPFEKKNNKNIFYPYFTKGTAGITSVALRYWYVFDNENLEKEINKLANGLDINFTLDMSFYTGLSGIANTFYDLYQYTGNKKYLVKTFELVNNMKQLLIKTSEDEIATPGSLLYRLSCDYSTGGSGFIMLIDRIIRGKGNFHFFLDDILKNSNMVASTCGKKVYHTLK